MCPPLKGLIELLWCALAQSQPNERMFFIYSVVLFQHNIWYYTAAYMNTLNNFILIYLQSSIEFITMIVIRLSYDIT